ncbi:MAG: helix-turn-helix domain-containing protein [Pseudomonadota bacterium]
MVDAGANAGMATAMLLLDISLRFPLMTMLLIIAALSLRDARHLLQGRLAAALCISLAAMLANTMPLAMEPPLAWRAIAWFVHIPNIALLWLFGLSLFEDDFRMTKIHWLILLAFYPILITMLVSTMIEREGDFILFAVLNRLLALGVLAHLLWTAIRGYQDDLVEGRRRTRLVFVVAIASAGLVIVGGETYQYFSTGGMEDPSWFPLARVVIILPLVMFSVHWFFRMRAEQFVFETLAPAKPTEPSVAPRDQAMYARLIAAMSDEKLYREHGLGIGTLATTLRVPEHQLRALINKGLGYRNFAAFLNQYRLAEAKEALSDPDQARTPILTIAMDAGYASLATFNRAFKTEEGLTPSAFRTEALSSAAQS